MTVVADTVWNYWTARAAELSEGWGGLRIDRAMRPAPRPTARLKDGSFAPLLSWETVSVDIWPTSPDGPAACFVPTYAGSMHFDCDHLLAWQLVAESINSHELLHRETADLTGLDSAAIVAAAEKAATDIATWLRAECAKESA